MKKTIFKPLLTLSLSSALLGFSTNSSAVWMTTGILDNTGAPAACLVVEENKYATTRMLLNKDLEIAKLEFISKVINKEDQKPIPFKRIKIDNDAPIEFASATKDTPKEIVNLFKKKKTALLITGVEKVDVPVSLTGFTRAYNACSFLMK